MPEWTSSGRRLAGLTCVMCASIVRSGMRTNECLGLKILEPISTSPTRVSVALHDYTLHLRHAAVVTG